ncbi:unknown [Crocosphaera subtropica ATCC 51142]|uniref:DJ-1/PfpI domain-containing protein n=1 Tax=Crocosphaera subtropica (strain ATCC 51142 / BH68) TaxID=43989 RepID=B1WPJ1_CROS5|nr:type 1 glutamine amidotransferase domain-containing protein [Crocosphaera subtropica]ACB51561.1 unknown [Crocosphaera subtropica ATCC 51142]
MTTEILLVLTSHRQLGETDQETGVWLEEAVNPYYRFLEAGFEVTLASPNGGDVPIDDKSILDEAQTEDTRHFFQDETAQKRFNNTVPLGQIKAEDYDAIFIPGGHGPMWDLCENEKLANLVEAFDCAGKIIAAVCHGPAGLLSAKKADGTPFVAGKKLTSFSNSEEETVGLHELVPFLLESRLKELGAKYANADDFQAKVVQDGNLITGQNPASSSGVAEAVIGSMKSLSSVGS